MKYLDYKDSREQGALNFPITLYRENPRSPRYVMPVHWHPAFEIIRILTGTFALTVNSKTHEYKAGDIVFIMDGFLHGGIPKDCTYECLVFDLNFLLREPNVCSKSLHDILDHRILVRELLSENSTEIPQIVDSLIDALSEKKPGYEFTAQGCLFSLLGVILEEHLYEEAGKDQKPERLNSLKNVLSYISENYGRSVTLDTLAKIAGMNPRYFCKYFRGLTGKTPIDYLNSYRIECACEMLSTRNVSVKETAISCGFNDESYFIKVFHKYKGVTPGEYMSMEF